MAWLKIEHETPEKPEILRIAATLGISQGDAFLACFRVWRWADQQSRDGHAFVTLASLDVIANCKGIGGALQQVGWLSVDDQGSVLIPRFRRHISQSAKERALATRRKQVSRSRAQRDNSVTKTRPREEKEKDIVIPPNTPPWGGLDVPLPNELNTPEFASAWADWLAYRTQQRFKRYKPIGLKTLFTRLAEVGPERATAAIRQSMANGWQGLFPEKVGGWHGCRERVGPRPGRVEAPPGKYAGVAIRIGPEEAPPAGPGGTPLAEGQVPGAGPGGEPRRPCDS
jgi:hypothetical protein